MPIIYLFLKYIKVNALSVNDFLITLINTKIMKLV